MAGFGSCGGSADEGASSPEVNGVDGNGYLLNRQWVEGKGKWSDEAQERLRTLMIEHDLFIHHKLTHSSNDRLRRLLDDFKHAIDPKSWDPKVHNHMLQVKVVGKINRIRRDMLRGGELRQENGGFILHNPQLISSETSLDDFREAAGRLSMDQLQVAIGILQDMVGIPASSTAFHEFILRNFRS